MAAMAKMTTSVEEVSVRPMACSSMGTTIIAMAAIHIGWYFLITFLSYSNRSIRSPSRPRGRNIKTRTINRYIEASPAGG